MLICKSIRPESTAHPPSRPPTALTFPSKAISRSCLELLLLAVIHKTSILACIHILLLYKILAHPGNPHRDLLSSSTSQSRQTYGHTIYTHHDKTINLRQQGIYSSSATQAIAPEKRHICHHSVLQSVRNSRDRHGGMDRSGRKEQVVLAA